jgi:hypothetical protein
MACVNVTDNRAVDAIYQLKLILVKSRDEHDPFSNWGKLLNRPVYSRDGKKIGFIRTIVSDYIVVKKGFVSLNRYFIPQNLAESIDKKGSIRLRINEFEVRSKYTHAKMRHTLTAVESIPETHIRHNPLHEISNRVSRS